MSDFAYELSDPGSVEFGVSDACCDPSLTEPDFGDDVEVSMPIGDDSLATDPTMYEPVVMDGVPVVDAVSVEVPVLVELPAPEPGVAPIPVDVGYTTAESPVVEPAPVDVGYTTSDAPVVEPAPVDVGYTTSDAPVAESAPVEVGYTSVPSPAVVDPLAATAAPDLLDRMISDPAFRQSVAAASANGTLEEQAIGEATIAQGQLRTTLSSFTNDALESANRELESRTDRDLSRYVDGTTGIGNIGDPY